MAVIENVLINGDLSQLSGEDRVLYYNKTCESSGLNPLTRPFEYIRLQGKLTLYARKDATDQLRAIHKISIKITAREKIDDVYIVTAHAINQEGRYDEATGAVFVGNLKGDALANAYLKAETKAKRRVTLSLAGLGLLDETEIETIPNAEYIDHETGEVIKKSTTHAPAKPPLQQEKRLSPPPISLDVKVQKAKEEIEKLYRVADNLGAYELTKSFSKELKQALRSVLKKEVLEWLSFIAKNPPPSDRNLNKNYGTV